MSIDFSKIKIWADVKKKMLALYDERYCIDIFLEREEASKGEIIIEYWDKDKLIDAVAIKSGELGSLQDFLELDQGILRPAKSAKINYSRRIK